MVTEPRFDTSSTITVRPNDIVPITVGTAFLGEQDDTIWIKVTSAPSGGCPWPWSYGLVTWITEEGRELGTVKVNGVCEGEVFRLGVGRAPSLRSGRLTFEPRSYNLKWIELEISSCDHRHHGMILGTSRTIDCKVATGSCVNAMLLVVRLETEFGH